MVNDIGAKCTIVFCLEYPVFCIDDKQSIITKEHICDYIYPALGNMGISMRNRYSECIVCCRNILRLSAPRPLSHGPFLSAGRFLVNSSISFAR